MVHIKLQSYEQLYYPHNEKAIPAVAIDLDRTNHTITIYRATLDGKGKEWKTFNTSEIGCLNIDTDYDCNNVENFDFLDEF